MTIIQLINNVLRLIGEQPLLTSDGNLGTLAKQSIQSAVYTVVSQTRHSSFMRDSTFNVTETNALNPAFTLPNRCMQISNVFYIDDAAAPPSFLKLAPVRREQLSHKLGYCVVGNNVHLAQQFLRPFDVVLEYYEAPLIEESTDDTQVNIALEVIKAIETTAAAWLSLSYLDDNAQQTKFEKLSQFEIEQLRRRSGVMRAPVSFRGN